MTPPRHPDEVIVRLRAEGPGPETAIRLRRWLKHALRSHGLRAVNIEPVEREPLTDADDLRDK